MTHDDRDLTGAGQAGAEQRRRCDAPGGTGYHPSAPIPTRGAAELLGAVKALHSEHPDWPPAKLRVEAERVLGEKKEGGVKETTHVIEHPFPTDPTDPEQIRARAEACGYCKGEPVGNAAVWAGCLEEGPLPCPRCGVTTRERS